MSAPADHEVIEAMQAHGGSFVQLLAALYAKADPQNRARIKVGWPEYWAEYEELASMLKRKRDAAAR